MKRPKRDIVFTWLDSSSFSWAVSLARHSASLRWWIRAMNISEKKNVEIYAIWRILYTYIYICMYVCMYVFEDIWRYLKNDIDGFAKLSQVPLSLFALSLRSRPSCASFHFFSEVFLVALPRPRYAQMTREKCFGFNTAPRFHVASSWSKWLAVAKRVLPEAWEFERDIPLHCTCHNSGESVQQRERMINHEKQEHSSQWS